MKFSQNGWTIACFSSKGSVTKALSASVNESWLMNLLAPSAWLLLCAVILGGLGLPVPQSFAQQQSPQQPAASKTNEIWLEVSEGAIQISEKHSNRWFPTQVSQPLKAGDRLRSGANARAMIWWSSGSRLSVGPSSELAVRERPPGEENGFDILRGLSRFLERNGPGRARITTPGAQAGVHGTEFVIQVDDQDRTFVWVIEGKVGLTNQFGSLSISDGQGLVAEPGKAPVPTGGFNPNNVLQWCLYYPAVLDLQELPLTAGEEQSLGDSLIAYAEGDLLAALQKYPEARQPQSDAEKIYYAALILSVGEVAHAQDLLGSLPAGNATDHLPRLAAALRQLIAAVKRQDFVAAVEPQTATELLAASYYQQSLAIKEISLETALKLARAASAKSPRFGLAWARMAELEFSFGRTKEAVDALGTALVLTPRNAEAISLQGFLLAAQNRIRQAIATFTDAIAIDPGLGNAWLGRGLCRIRQGDRFGGRQDLLTAAALEPQRAVLRSYLGKAYGNEGDFPRANRELDLAKRLDPNDPTSWLYSALLKQQQNRINEAIADLEKSEELNDNRSLYRSQMLLDQDRAVRSANLARIYREAGLDQVALQTAARAVASDYGNYSAHLFLANSYQELVSQNHYDLRYDTPAFNEYLLARLLGPADGRLLAQPLTQQEYTRLFEQNTLGLGTTTEYLSRGGWNQQAVQYGTVANSSYALAGEYLSDPGTTPNGHQQQWELSLRMKQMLTPQDGLFIEIGESHRTTGDLARRYDPDAAIRGLELRERQTPSVLAGLDHQWNDIQRTLVLFSYVDSTREATNPHGPVFLVSQTFGTPDGFSLQDLSQEYHSRMQIGSFELQHLVQTPRFKGIAGVRIQGSSDEASNKQTLQVGNSPGYEIYFGNPGDIITNQSSHSESLRVSPYFYGHFRIWEPLWLIAGLSYDYQSEPMNTRFAPIADQNEIERQFCPKAALIWNAVEHGFIRAAYSRSLGGFDLEQSLRLEPTQLAGFVQVYRDSFPDSVVGGISGARVDTGGIAMDYHLPSRTYLVLSAQILRSTRDHNVGAFERDLFTSQGPAIQIAESLRFQEESLDVSVEQLIADWFSVGARYRLADAKLSQSYPGINPSLGKTEITEAGLLHSIRLQALAQHPSGLFAGLEAEWWSQILRDDLSATPGSSFWQENLVLGFRFPGRRAQITMGLLNVTGTSYRLHPINLYPDLPRERTLFARLELNF
jgi:Tfp pilus assembly protein PilF